MKILSPELIEKVQVPVTKVKIVTDKEDGIVYVVKYKRKAKYWIDGFFWFVDEVFRDYHTAVEHVQNIRRKGYVTHERMMDTFTLTDATETDQRKMTPDHNVVPDDVLVLNEGNMFAYLEQLANNESVEIIDKPNTDEELEDTYAPILEPEELELLKQEQQK